MKIIPAGVISFALLSLLVAPPAVADEQSNAALANQMAGFLATAPSTLKRELPSYKDSEFRNVRLGIYSYPLRQALSWSFVICGENKLTSGGEYDWSRFAVAGGTGMKASVVTDVLETKSLCESNFEDAKWLDKDLTAEISPTPLSR